MSLKIIYGRAGSGKSHYCMTEIRNRVEERVRRPLILLVPEQYSMQAERNLVQTLPRGGAIGAQVLSFRRMAYRVFEEVGGFAQRHINPAGRSMLIYRIIDELKGELHYFDKMVKQWGFVNTISQLISELKRYNITPDMFQELYAQVEDESLKEKVREIGLIYNRFEETLHKRYIDADDDLTLMAEKIRDTNQFNDAEIWVDEFTGFTPQEYRVIGELMKKAKRINVCLCTNYLLDEMSFLNSDVFAPVRNTASRLMGLAKEHQMAIDNPISLNNKPLHRYRDSRELAHLEKYYFTFPYERYEDATEDIKIFTASNIYTEIEQAAQNILALCRDRGLRFKDIAVVTRNLPEYEKLISAIFTQYNIPFFIDRKKPIDSHPLITMILSMMDIFIHNWSYEAVFRYLKTGLVGLDREDIDILENYVLANGIRGNQWLKGDWEYRPDSGFSTRDITERERLIIERANKARRQVIGPLVKFRDKTKGRTSIRTMCTSTYEFLIDIGIPERIEDRIQALNNKKLLNLANEYGQIWNIVMQVLDQVVEAMGEESMGIERFRNILDIGFQEHQIGLIPPSLDQVLVGSVERSRNHEIKALFILGVNDGVFPAPPGEEGLLSDRDRQTFRSMGVELAQDTKSQAFEEQFITYSTLTTTGGTLYVSYPIADHEGGTLRPSIIISRLRKLFPNITIHSNLVQESSMKNRLNQVSAVLPTFNELIFAVRQDSLGQPMDPLWKQVRKWYGGNEDWKERLDRVEKWTKYTNQVDSVDEGQVQRLYGSTIYSSISRLEQYAACPFSHYIRYGLKAKERKVYQLSPPDLGSFMHDAIDAFSKHIKDLGMGWDELDKEWCEQEISTIVNTLLEEKMGWLINNSDRYRYLMTRLKRIINRAIWIIREHIIAGNFEPIGYELSFGESGEDKFPPIILELPSGKKVHLVGRIDRVDALEKEEGTYIRIIDYKSGSRDFKLSDVYHGLQIQLITYLGAVLDSGEKVFGDKMLPGGMFYFHLDDPMIRVDGRMDDEYIEHAIMKELRMKGLVLADTNLIRAMDRDIDGTSIIIPARINKGGSLGKSSAASLDQFSKLSKHSEKLLTQIAMEMTKGKIAINPYREKQMTACEYCSYPSICQFDPSLENNHYRFLRTMRDEDVWGSVEKEEDGHGQ